MNRLIESCILEHFDLEDVPPMIETTYNDARTRIQSDDNALTIEQINHFEKILDYLSDTNINYVSAVHIVSFSITGGVKHYVQININTKYDYHMYIDYRPEIFRSATTQIIENLRSSNDLRVTPVKKVNYIRWILGFITIVNCFGYSFLYRMLENPDYLRTIINHPFKSSVATILDGVGYTLIGGFISQLCGVYSSVIFNGFMIYVNLFIFKQMKLG